MAHISGLSRSWRSSKPLRICRCCNINYSQNLRGPRGGMILCNNPDIAKKVNSAIFPGIQGGPLMHVIAAKAVAFKEALSDEFVQYQKQVIKNAKTLAETLQDGGLDLVTGGTDTHVLLVDLRKKKVTGATAEKFLGKEISFVIKMEFPSILKNQLLHLE